MSCVVVDNLESLIDYGPIGPRYSNLTLQTLLVLLKKQPPKGKRLLIICTTSRKEVLQQMEMLSAFTDVLHVSNLGKAEHIERVVATDPGFSDKERQAIRGNFILIFVRFCPILSNFVQFCQMLKLFNSVQFCQFVQFCLICPKCPICPICPILSNLSIMTNFVHNIIFVHRSIFVLNDQFCPSY